MTSKTRCRVGKIQPENGLSLLPAPRSSEDVLSLVRYASELAPTDGKMAAHLAEMGNLFPNELLGAFRAFLRKQIGRN